LRVRIVVKADKIYIVGFLAAGKTTVARLLGRRLGWPVEDIDDLIETRERRSIAEIFSASGEPYFRAVEREVVRSLLVPRNIVVATGGGTFVDPESRGLIGQDGLSIWLDVPLDEIVARVPADGRRPLATDRAQMERLYAARRPAYQRAHLRLDASRAPAGELVERILDWLGF
jgi:shikimate kinase